MFGGGSGNVPRATPQMRSRLHEEEAACRGRHMSASWRTANACSTRRDGAYVAAWCARGRGSSARCESVKSRSAT
eukprot:6291936-Heterocapsa_arctica.AAC.1